MADSPPMLSRYMVPDMPDADDLLPWLRQIDAGRWYSNFGPLVLEFERRIAIYLAKIDKMPQAEPLEVVTLASCYHALQIGLQIMRLPANAKVLIPAMTFPACPLAVQHAGAEPVLADIDSESWQLTPAIARRAAAAMTIDAVMPVALYGVPVPADEWDRFTEETGIPVIIDAAAAFETQAIPKKCMVAHSLHATKPFCIGEGGLLIARNHAVIDEARCISNFGTNDRIAVRDGSNAKLSEYHGAVGLAQLARWADIKQRRGRMFADIRAAVEEAGLPVSFQTGIEHTIVGPLMLKTEEPCAEAVTAILNARGIFAHRMYLPPLYRHPHFAGLPAVNSEGRLSPASASPTEKQKLMENSEMMLRHIFGVPFHAYLDPRDVDFMTDALADVLEQPAKSKVAMA